MTQESATVAFFQPKPAKISTRYLNLGKQLPRRARIGLLGAHFLQHNGVAVPLQARKNLIKKGHACLECVTEKTLVCLRVPGGSLFSSTTKDARVH